MRSPSPPSGSCSSFNFPTVSDPVSGCRLHHGFGSSDKGTTPPDPVLLLLHLAARYVCGVGVWRVGAGYVSSGLSGGMCERCRIEAHAGTWDGENAWGRSPCSSCDGWSSP